MGLKGIREGVTDALSIDDGSGADDFLQGKSVRMGPPTEDPEEPVRAAELAELRILLLGAM